MSMPTHHLQQLEAIDQTYWWHRVRWRIIRWCIRRFTTQRSFACYFDIGSGGGGLPGLLAQDFAFKNVLLFDQHEVSTHKSKHVLVQQRVVDLETFDWGGVPSPQLITCLDVLEHLEYPERLLRALRALTQNSRPLLIVTVPAMERLWSSWDRAAGHYRRYERNELHRLLESAGWVVDQCSYFFHAAVLPLMLRRHARYQEKTLEFPRVPRWVNATAEGLFWTEYQFARPWRLPFGSSLLAVAH